MPEDGHLELQVLAPAVAPFFAHLRNRGRALSTVLAYRNRLKPLARYLSDRGLRLPDVEPAHLDGYVSDLTRRRLNSTTRRALISVVREFFRYAHGKRLLPTNPAEELWPPPIREHLPVTLEASEVSRLIAACDLETELGRRDAALLAVMFATGVRPSEACALTFGDVQPTQAQDGSRAFVLTIPSGKNRRERRLPLCTVGALYLSAAVGDKGRMRSPFLFANLSTGAPLSTRAVGLIFTKYAKKARLGKSVSPKTARHTFGTIALDDGMPFHLVQEWLGHKSPESTRVYTRITARALLAGAKVHNPLLKAFPELSRQLEPGQASKSDEAIFTAGRGRGSA